jgi:hypothetical protein
MRNHAFAIKDSDARISPKQGHLGVVGPNSIRWDPSAATFNGFVIPMAEITQVVLNEATDVDGGSAIIKTIPRANNPQRDSRIFNVTFAPHAIKLAKGFLKTAQSNGVATRIVRGKDSLFKEMYFISP